MIPNLSDSLAVAAECLASSTPHRPSLVVAAMHPWTNLQYAQKPFWLFVSYIF
jgi:hypothetical protein